MTIDIAAVSHLGCIRKNNEDAFLINPLDGSEPLINPRLVAPIESLHGHLVAVADGMGGAAAGEIASREGLACLALYVFGHWARFPGAASTEATLLEALRGGVQEASDALIRYSCDDRSSRGMGSTLTAIIFWNDFAYIAQIGDSRAYIYRNRELVQLTDDQTLIAQMVAAGNLTSEQARQHPQRNMVTQALGSPKSIEVDIKRLKLEPGDTLMLCSDGLHGEVSDAEILQVLQGEQDARTTAQQLLQRALESGGRDNVTLVVIGIDKGRSGRRKASGRLDLVKIIPDQPIPSSGLLSRLGRMITGRE